MRKILSKPMWLLAVLLVGAAGGAIGHAVSQEQLSASQKIQAKVATKKQSSRPAPPKAELLIREWGVGIPLPASLQNQVEYEIGQPIVDPMGIRIEQAKFFVANADSANNECETSQHLNGNGVYVATQLLRTPQAEQLDTVRYRGTFRVGILRDGTHTYHANYVIPDCAGPQTQAQIKALQSSLSSLRTTN